MPVKQDLVLLMQELERLKPHPRKFPPHRQFRVGPFLRPVGAHTPLTLGNSAILLLPVLNILDGKVELGS